MKYIHIIINISYTAPYIHLVNDNFNSNEHVFFVVGGWSEEKIKIPSAENVIKVTNIRNLFNGFILLTSLYRAKKIFFHGLFNPILMWMLVLQPWLFRKSNWVIWGGDLYGYQQKKVRFIDKVNEFLRRICIKNFAELTTVIKGDYELAKKWYGATGLLRRAMYSTPLNLENIDQILAKDTFRDDDCLNIQIGNSSSKENNHFEILDSLEIHKDRKIKIFAMLSYGDKDYGQEVISYGKRLFGDKFIAVVDFMNFEDFTKFMNSMDVIIFNHERQQAFGNFLLGVYLKKKIFMNTKSTLWDLITEEFHISIYETQSISNNRFEKLALLDGTILEDNKLKVKKILSNAHICNMWAALFE